LTITAATLEGIIPLWSRLGFGKVTAEQEEIDAVA
jgi:hypothetical protein